MARKYFHVRGVVMVGPWSLDCLATHANAGVAQSMKSRVKILIFIALLICAIANRANADGGQVIATATLGREHAVMMVNPSMPTVGMVALIVRASPGLEPFECILSARSQVDSVPIQCILGPDPDGLGQRALIECADASNWIINARISTSIGVIELNGEFTVAPAPPNWQTQSPWILIWVPLAIVLFIRQRARRNGKHYDVRYGVS